MIKNFKKQYQLLFEHKTLFSRGSVMRTDKNIITTGTMKHDIIPHSRINNFYLLGVWFVLYI